MNKTNLNVFFENLVKKYFSWKTILPSTLFIYVVSLTSYAIFQHWDKETLLSAQAERLSEISAQLIFIQNNLADEYDFQFLPQCNAKIPYLTDKNLNLRVDKWKKTISPIDVFNALKISKGAKITRIVHSQKQLKTDLGLYKDISIGFEDDKYNIYFNANRDTARTVDFQILINDPVKSNCVQTIRLFFSDSVDPKGQWQVISSIGRNGMGIGEFSLPYGTEFFEGRLWTTDCSNENISVFNLDGQFVDSFSEFGSGSGKFDTPADMKIFNDKIYVVEERNHRVQVFSMTGEPLFLFGAYKETDNPDLFVDKFNNPLGISVTEKLIVVVDYGNQRILAYNHDFKHVWTSSNKGGDPFEWENPYYIEFNYRKDHFVISNQLKSSIGILSKTGEKIRAFGDTVLGVPFELAVTPGGDVIVADTTKKQIVVFDGTQNYKVKERLIFGDKFGIPKTVTALSKNEMLVGFVGNGPAYFLHLRNTKEPNEKLEKEGPRPIFDKSETNKVQDSPLEGPDNPNWVYSTYCASCHEGGSYGAPARGNIESWARYSQDLEGLLAKTKSGKGAMIAKGGCGECSDQQLMEAIKLLVPKVWE